MTYVQKLICVFPFYKCTSILLEKPSLFYSGIFTDTEAVFSLIQLFCFQLKFEAPDLEITDKLYFHKYSHL